MYYRCSRVALKDASEAKQTNKQKSVKEYNAEE
jgi:hypothetical protein